MTEFSFKVTTSISFRDRWELSDGNWGSIGLP